MHIRRQGRRNMHGQVIFFLGIDNRGLVALSIEQAARITNLTPHVAIEGGVVQYDLIVGLAFGGHPTVTGNMHSVIRVMVIAHKLRLFDRQHFDPVVGFDRRGVARTVLLRFEFGLKAGDIDRYALFRGNQLGQVDGETEGIIKCKGIRTANHPFRTIGRQFPNNRIKQVNPRSQRPKERALLFGNHLFDKLLLRLQFRELSPHLFDEGRHEPTDKGFGKAQIGIAVAHRTAQDTANHIPRLHVAGQLPVGNRKGNGPQVVGHHPHGNIFFGVSPVGRTAHRGNLLQERLEDIRVVVGFLALNHHAEPFETHPRIDVFGGQRLERTVSLTVELHEDQVPDFNHLRVVVIDQRRPVHLSPFSLVTQVEVNLRAGTARTRIAHLPEIVLFIPLQNMAGRQTFRPKIVCLAVKRNPFVGSPLEHRGIESVHGQFITFGQQLPRPGNGLFLEIVPETPVPQHLEHRVVVGVVAHLFEVVVFAAHPQTLLRVGYPMPLCRLVAQENILKLVHPGIGEHQRGVILDHHRSRRHNLVLLFAEKVEEDLADFVRVHISFFLFCPLIMGNYHKLQR